MSTNDKWWRSRRADSIASSLLTVQAQFTTNRCTCRHTTLTQTSALNKTFTWHDYPLWTTVFKNGLVSTLLPNRFARLWMITVTGVSVSWDTTQSYSPHCWWSFVASWWSLVWTLQENSSGHASPCWLPTTSSTYAVFMSSILSSRDVYLTLTSPETVLRSYQIKSKFALEPCVKLYNSGEISKLEVLLGW